MSFVILLRVCFVASYLQKYGCIRLDSFSYKTQNVSLVLVSAEKSSLVPQERHEGVQFRIWSHGSMVSPMPEPLFFFAFIFFLLHHPQLVGVASSLQHSCHSPSIILTQTQTGKTDHFQESLSTTFHMFQGQIWANGHPDPDEAEAFST